MTQYSTAPRHRAMHRLPFVLVLLSIASPAAANPASGRYGCYVGGAYFTVELQGNGNCSSYLPAQTPQACNWAYDPANRLLTFSDSARPELRIYTVYFVAAGNRGQAPDRVGPGLEAFNERSLLDPPTNAGWCQLQG